MPPRFATFWGFHCRSHFLSGLLTCFPRVLLSFLNLWFGNHSLHFTGLTGLPLQPLLHPGFCSVGIDIVYSRWAFFWILESQLHKKPGLFACALHWFGCITLQGFCSVPNTGLASAGVPSAWGFTTKGWAPSHFSLAHFWFLRISILTVVT